MTRDPIASTQRDPRWEPRPGDVIRKTLLVSRVSAVIESGVYYWTKSGRPAAVTLAEWRQWADQAQVITRGENNDSSKF